jgi:hypothetical protein
MRPYKVLFLCDDCVASAPVLEALRTGGFRLHIAHSLYQVSAHRGERADVIVILSPHHANAWIARLKLLAGTPAPVILLCSGPEPLTTMPPPVDAVCHAESLKSVLNAVLRAASSSAAPVQMLYPPLVAGYQPG